MKKIFILISINFDYSLFTLRVFKFLRSFNQLDSFQKVYRIKLILTKTIYEI